MVETKNESDKRVRKDDRLAFAVNGVLLSAGAALAALVVNVLQDPELTSESGERRACAKCGGSGFVDCFCTRWDYASAAGAKRKYHAEHKREESFTLWHAQ